MAKARTQGKNRTKSRSNPIEVQLSAYANEVEEREGLMNQLKLFYKAAMASQIGFARGKDKDGNEVGLLVGVERHQYADDTLHPIGTLISVEDVESYSLPDGKGNYVQFQLT